jgi:integrase
MPDRYRPVVILVAATGLRQGEAFGVHVRDVDFLRRTLTVARQVQPGPVVGPLKNKAAYRVVPLGDVVLTRWRSTCGGTRPDATTSSSGRPTADR